MSMSSIPSSSQSGKLYGWVERIGNKVPHPFLLFIYLIIVLMVTTAILSAFGVSAKKPDRWYAGGREKPAQCGSITLVFTQCY